MFKSNNTGCQTARR